MSLQPTDRDANLSSEANGETPSPREKGAGDPGASRRLRDDGILIGRFPTGPHNAITDVKGVRVGQVTLVSGDGPLEPGREPVRTGVTAILPHGGNLFREKVPAAIHVINGFGKAVGLAQVQELGEIETPILLTNTLAVGPVAGWLVEYMLEGNPDIGITTGTVNPVVAECNDGYLNDIRGRHIRREHVFRAIEAAKDGPVAEGSVGAGTGMTAFRFKAGIGTASRVIEVDRPAAGGDQARGYTLGALVLANFGRRRELLVKGVPVGELLEDYGGEETAGGPVGSNPQTVSAAQQAGSQHASSPAEEQGGSRQKAGSAAPEASAAEPGPGSIVVILATDAPLDSRQLGRVARRAVAGIARTGSHLSHGSGDFVIAVSTARRIPHNAGEEPLPLAVLSDQSRTMDHLFTACVEAVEEAILNSLWVNRSMTGRDGHFVPALPRERVLTFLRRATPS